MLPIPASLLARANSVGGARPMMMAAIFASNGPSDSLSTAYRMTGAKDPAKAGDLNVTVQADSGELVLSPGAAVALDQTTTPLAAVYSTEWTVYITDHAHYVRVGTWPFDHLQYVHDYYSAAVVLAQSPVSLPFTAAGTCTADSLRIQLGNSGNLATTATVRFVDVADKRQVGNAITLALAAGAPYLIRVLSGFAAGLVRARKYALEIAYSVPATDGLGWALCNPAVYSIKIRVGGFSSGSITALWRIQILEGCIPLGGRAGYMSAGYAYRSLDVCASGAAAPTDYGVVSFSDVIPALTSLTVTAWATDSAALYAAPGVTGWVSFGRLASGSTVPPHRYWRFKVALTANPECDDSARLASLSVSYMSAPIVLATHAQDVVIPGLVNSYRARAVKAINNVSSSTSALEPKAKTVMLGQVTLDLAPEPAVAALYSKPLRGKRVVMHAGYADVNNASILYYDGIVRDLAFQGGRYILTIQDPLELASVSIPRDRWPLWQAATAYNSGVTVSWQNKSYLALAATTGQQPDLYPAVWQDAGNVWKDAVYSAGTHLCDVAADILQNQVNMPSEKIDLASLDAIKALCPARVTGGRTISNPESAIDNLSDIAWLTESYWTMREGRLALIAEAPATAAPVGNITPHDIKNSLQYRRGWAELKNECLILTQYTGTGSGNEQYQNAIAVADAQSVTDYGIAAVHEFKDKWNVPSAELTGLATTFVTRWKNGRRIVRVDASMRMLPYETGDVMTLQSTQLPSGDKQKFNCIVMQKDLDWMGQSIQITLMEV